MAEDSWPSVDHAAGAMSDVEFEEWASPATATGLVGVPTDLPLVFGDSSGRQVKFRSGRFGLVRGHTWYAGSSDVTKSVGANSSGSTRYDLAVLKMDRGDNWNVRAFVHQGTAGAGVPAATQNTGGSGIWEFPVASIKVDSGAPTITNTDVTPLAWYLAAPSITCTSTTRPPPALGLRIYESDTKKELVGNGSAFVGSIDDTGWFALTASSGWNVGTASLRKYNGTVFFDASFKRVGGTLASNSVSAMGTIPNGYRPGIQQRVGAFLDGANEVVVTVETSGAINVRFYATSIATNKFVTTFGKSWPLG